MKICNSCLCILQDEKTKCPHCNSKNILSEALSPENKSDLKITEIHFNNKKFKIRELIGRGGFGAVIKIVNGASVYALKLPLSFLQYFSEHSHFDEDTVEYSEEILNKEIRRINLMLKRFEDKPEDQLPTIKIIDTGEALCSSDNLTYKMSAILMELASGSLQDLYTLEDTHNCQINFSDKMDLISSLVSNLDKLHKAKIIHRDIAPANLLLVPRNNKFSLVFSDFGTLRSLCSDMTKSSTITAHMEYIDPARYLDSAYNSDPRQDIYSTGIIISEILSSEKWRPGANSVRTLHDFMEYFLERKKDAGIPAPFYKILKKTVTQEGAKKFKSSAHLKRVTLKCINKFCASQKNNIIQFPLYLTVKSNDQDSSECSCTDIHLKPYKSINITQSDSISFNCSDYKIKKIKFSGNFLTCSSFKNSKISISCKQKSVEKMLKRLTKNNSDKIKATFRLHLKVYGDRIR